MQARGRRRFQQHVPSPVTTQYLHRVLEEDAPKWVARGWKIVMIEDSSPSLRAQNQRVALLEYVGEGDPRSVLDE